MRVLERHEPENQWPRVFECAGCTSKLEVGAHDITLPGQRDGYQGWFRCPVCNILNYVTRAETREVLVWRTRHGWAQR